MLVLVTQTIWAVNSYTQSKKDLKTRVRAALAITAKKTTDRSACFEIFSKAYIKPGEGFYMSKFNAEKNSDTLPMLFTGRGYFYDEAKQKFLEKYNNFTFSRPTSAEIVINFRYHIRDTAFSKISQDSIFNQLGPGNYQEVFSDHLNIDKLYDLKFMDSTLHSELMHQSIDFPYSTGIIESGKDSIVYKTNNATNSELIKSDYVSDLNEEGYFDKHYKLSLVFTNRFIVGKNLWLMLLTSTFVVLLLVILMWQFIRVITRQKKINEMKNDFINNMTHEFNTPLANISLAAESLARFEELQRNEKTSHLVTIIREQNENIRGNVEHILKIASNDKEGIVLNKEKLNVSELVKSVVYEFNFALSEKKGQIHFLEPSDLLFIWADELYILHALQNIIDNAIKYSHDKPLITISAQALESYIVITVEDKGIGMSKEDIKYIFDKFYRVSTGNIHHTKGFGLGLNYVQSILKAHGGLVKVKSTPGKGSSFSLYIPKAQ